MINMVISFHFQTLHLRSLKPSYAIASFVVHEDCVVSLRGDALECRGIWKFLLRG